MTSYAVLSLSREHKQLEMSHNNPDEVASWKSSFLRAGVFPEDSNQTNGADHQEDYDGKSESPVFRSLMLSISVILPLVPNCFRSSSPFSLWFLIALSLCPLPLFRFLRSRWWSPIGASSGDHPEFGGILHEHRRQNHQRSRSQDHRPHDCQWSQGEYLKATVCANWLHELGQLKNVGQLLLVLNWWIIPK